MDSRHMVGLDPVSASNGGAGVGAASSSTMAIASPQNTSNRVNKLKQVFERLTGAAALTAVASVTERPQPAAAPSPRKRTFVLPKVESHQESNRCIQQSNIDSSEQIAKLEREVADWCAKFEHEQADKLCALERLRALENAHTTEIQSLKSRIQSLEVENSALSEHFEAAESERSTQLLAQITALEEKLLARETQIAQIEQKSIDSVSLIQRLQEDNARLRSELQAASSQSSVAQSELQKSLETAQNRIKQLEEENQSMLEDLKNPSTFSAILSASQERTRALAFAELAQAQAIIAQRDLELEQALSKIKILESRLRSGPVGAAQLQQLEEAEPRKQEAEPSVSTAAAGASRTPTIIVTSSESSLQSKLQRFAEDDDEEDDDSSWSLSDSTNSLPVSSNRSSGSKT